MDIGSFSASQDTPPTDPTPSPSIDSFTSSSSGSQSQSALRTAILYSQEVLPRLGRSKSKSVTADPNVGASPVKSMGDPKEVDFSCSNGDPQEVDLNTSNVNNSSDPKEVNLVNCDPKEVNLSNSSRDPKVAQIVNNSPNDQNGVLVSNVDSVAITAPDSQLGDASGCSSSDAPNNSIQGQNVSMIDR